MCEADQHSHNPPVAGSIPIRPLPSLTWSYVADEQLSRPVLCPEREGEVGVGDRSGAVLRGR